MKFGIQDLGFEYKTPSPLSAFMQCACASSTTYTQNLASSSIVGSVRLTVDIWGFFDQSPQLQPIGLSPAP